jgi:D-aminopeptidase
MVCHEFKGGIGTASRVLREAAAGYAVGVLVQANYGKRSWLRVDGVRVGEAIPVSEVPSPWDEEEGRRTLPAGSGSIIVVVATDAPLLPPPVRAPCPASRPGDRARRRDRWPYQRRPLHRLLDRQ